jgi:hypothetical protein
MDACQRSGAERTWETSPPASPDPFPPTSFDPTRLTPNPPVAARPQTQSPTPSIICPVQRPAARQVWAYPLSEARVLAHCMELARTHKALPDLQARRSPRNTQISVRTQFPPLGNPRPQPPNMKYQRQNPPSEIRSPRNTQISVRTQFPPPGIPRPHPTNVKRQSQIPPPPLLDLNLEATCSQSDTDAPALEPFSPPTDRSQPTQTQSGRSRRPTAARPFAGGGPPRRAGMPRGAPPPHMRRSKQ